MLGAEGFPSLLINATLSQFPQPALNMTLLLPAVTDCHRCTQHIMWTVTRQWPFRVDSQMFGWTLTTSGPMSRSAGSAPWRQRGSSTSRSEARSVSPLWARAAFAVIGGAPWKAGSRPARRGPGGSSAGRPSSPPLPALRLCVSPSGLLSADWQLCAECDGSVLILFFFFVFFLLCFSAHWGVFFVSRTRRPEPESGGLELNPVTAHRSPALMLLTPPWARLCVGSEAGDWWRGTAVGGAAAPFGRGNQAGHITAVKLRKKLLVAHPDLTKTLSASINETNETASRFTSGETRITASRKNALRECKPPQTLRYTARI